VEIFGVGATNNLVQGNFIGTDPTGTASLGNGVGVEIAGGAHNNVIGGPVVPTVVVAGAGNVIAHNTGTGVVIGSSISDAATVGNSIRGNSIYQNGGLGIDLGNDGVTPNHKHKLVGRLESEDHLGRRPGRRLQRRRLCRYQRPSTAKRPRVDDLVLPPERFDYQPVGYLVDGGHMGRRANGRFRLTAHLS
jgi:hypothetical protein